MSRLKEIIDRQYELMVKFHKIEKNNHQLPDYIKGNLQNRHTQERLRHLAWCMTEEVSEMMKETDTAKKRVEAIDVLHFLAEFIIVSGIKLDKLLPVPELYSGNHLEYLMHPSLLDDYIDQYKSMRFDGIAFRFLIELGWLCNCLKAKPWKQNPKITSEPTFTMRLRDVVYTFFALLQLLEMDENEVYSTYFGKALENVNRQRVGA